MARMRLRARINSLDDHGKPLEVSYYYVVDIMANEHHSCDVDAVGSKDQARRSAPIAENVFIRTVSLQSAFLV